MKIFFAVSALLIAHVSRAITCTGSDPCTFDCSGESSCKGETLTCTPGVTSCLFNCNGEDSCQNSELDCNDATSCTINCFGESSCKGTFNADCGTASTCSLECSAESACQGGELDCQSSTCSMACSAEDACKDGDFNCSSATCSLSCTNSGTSCQDLVVDGAVTCTGDYCGEIGSILVDADVADDDDDSSDDDDDDDDDSDDDDDDAAVPGAVKSIGSILSGDNNDDENTDGHSEQIVISFSKNAMMNIWALIIGCLVVNLVIAWCYCFKSKKTRVTFEDQGDSRV